MHMAVPGTYFLVIPTVKVLGEIVSKILLTWMSLNLKVSLSDLISYPEKSHFHGPRLLIFNSVICNADCCEIVTVYCDWGLRMYQLFKFGSKYVAFFRIK